MMSTSLPPHVKLEIPALSPTMKEGVIASWVKNEGDQVEAGQPVCEIETDKATVDYEVQDQGYLAKILVPAGGPPKPCGTIIGILVEEKEDIPAFANYTVEETPSMAETKSEPVSESKSVSKPESSKSESKPEFVASKGSRVFISPLAKVTAHSMGIDYSGITGSGPNGRIIKVDIDRYEKQEQPQAPVGINGDPSAVFSGGISGGISGYVDYPVSQDTQAIADALTKSKSTVPHYYVSAEIDISSLLSLREKLNESLPDKISVHDFVIRASALSMKHVPQVNSSWGGSFVRQYENSDINVAIINKDQDVMMPVIRAANNKGLSAISKECRSFLKGIDMDVSNGTFTITNMGAYGLKSYTPIVREPQTCSLGVGTIVKRVVPGDGINEDGSPEIKVVSVMTVTLSSDHRVLDGALAATWLQEFKSLMQDPLKMLL